jgi:hypothetical protein
MQFTQIENKTIRSKNRVNIFFCFIKTKKKNHEHFIIFYENLSEKCCDNTVILKN